MAKKTRGLGRGLDSLFMDTEQWGASIQEIPIGELDQNPDQPRKAFDPDGLKGLADSIREHGVLQPLLVAPTAGGRFQIIAGERRFRAGRMAGLETLPCVVRDIDILQQMEITLIENLQREDLNPLEEAVGIEALMQQCGYTQEKVGQRLGMSRTTVTNALRLLDLTEEVRELVRKGDLSAGAGKALAGLENGDVQLWLAQKTIREHLPVRQVETLVAELKKNGEKLPGQTQPSRPKELLPELGELQEKLRMRTGLKSTLTGSINRGKIVLQYSSRDELERLNELLDQLDGQ